jgi:lipopolysaccharide export system protein LptA
VKKALIVFFICLCPALLFAQQTITVVSNIKVSYNEKRGTYRWYKPVFSHEGSTLAADSADYNQGDNFFDAFGNVVITQPNGTVAYADKLHYTEDNQQAVLTNNVRLIDRQATLTTNHLTYNMRSKRGTYINGGQIINGLDTLNSQNGYYFENTQDAYFRYNVVVRTPDVKIHTDTMRYNSGSKMTYFYGPTTIDGQNGKLYTENGDYNTETDNARFGKNNLYTEGSKFLWGDSLLYDGKSGNGRAIKNVNFVDTTQHIVMRGQLGTYTKETQTTLVTQNAYIVIATKPDSVENETQRDSTFLTEVTPLKDSINFQTDSTQHSLDSTLRPPPSNRTDSTYMSADTLLSQVIKLKDYKFANLKMSREGGELEDEGDDYSDEDDSFTDGPQINEGTLNEADSLSITTDSLSTIDSLSIKESIPIDSLKKEVDLMDSLNMDRLDSKLLAEDSLSIQDSISLKEALPLDSIKKKAESLRVNSHLQDSLDIDSLGNEIPDVLKTEIDSLINGQTLQIPTISDTSSYAIDSTLVMPKSGDVDSIINKATQTALSNAERDSLLSDTAETRIVIAYHDVRIFKSDLQGIADSAYFGFPDSLIRCFGSPIFWSQGSQLSADTVYLQLKNQKIDNMLLQNKAFIVSTELDSSKYHQVKGKKISGFFTNDKLDRVFVDGNAESIYYIMENNTFTGMVRSISSRIKVLFNDNSITDVISIRKAATDYYPILKVPEDKEFLEGFIWKPELRPKSKEEVILRPQRREEVIPEVETNETDSVQTGNPIKRESEPEEDLLQEDEVKTNDVQKEELKKEELSKKQPTANEDSIGKESAEKEELKEVQTEEPTELEGSQKESPNQEEEKSDNNLKGEQEVN